MTGTLATNTDNGNLMRFTSVTYVVYKSKLVGCPAETICKNFGLGQWTGRREWDQNSLLPVHCPKPAFQHRLHLNTKCTPA